MEEGGWLGSVGINNIWFVKGSLANWYPMGMGPAGDCIWWVDIQGLCPPMPPGLGPGSGVAEGGAPDVGTKRLEATGEDPGTHPVGEVNGGQLGGIEVPGWVPGCLWRPMAIPTGMLDPKNSRRKMKKKLNQNDRGAIWGKTTDKETDESWDIFMI